MSEWELKSLSEIAVIRVSNVDKKSRVFEQPVKLCNYMDVYSNEYITKDIQFMESTASSVEKEKFKVCSGDVIITKDSETPYDIGISAVVIDDIPELVCGYHLALIKPNPEQINSVYLSKQLASSSTSEYFSRRAAGSTRYGLSNGAISAVPIFVAPKKQQQKIAVILTKIDQTIKKTEALIHKYQQIKAGLMHDLFTRGVTADGKLRPPREQAPELYKETLIGWIPIEWGIAVVREHGSIKLGRQRSPDKHSGKWTTPYLRVANVYDGFIDFSDVLEMDFTPNERETFSVKHGDILLNEGQSLELVGRSALYLGEDDKCCFQNTLVRFRCYRNNLPLFYGFLFKWWLDRGLFMQISKQTTSVAHLGADRFARMVCPVLSFTEQQTITEKLSSIQARIETEKAQLKKFQKQKSGLMHDLLTGKVPVKINQ